ncbi:sensor histidine kinase [Hamadaea flava]|uniref:histidine kinase n=1 Tax=Hamadaea flava TaxID=1742688 RepID=A0ABV8LW99_9ACTN|nr:histidine kinase [Hamadaea flava]
MHLPRAIWAEPRPPDAPPRGRRDWVFVGLVVVLAVVEFAARPSLRGHPLALLVTLGLAPTLLWRRSRPLLALAAAFVVSGLVAALAPEVPDSYVMIYVLVLPYALFRWGSGREMVAGLVLMAANLAVSVAVDRLSRTDAFGGAAILCTALALGAALRFRVKARTRELEQVRLVERERLARDLHDTVAHHFSAIVIRAQAGLAVAPVQPEAPMEALRIIETEATRALGEMRTIVRVLRRDEAAELAPNPGIADLPGLADHPGPPVAITVEGDLRELPTAVGAALYRLAQESVTNARRHARHASRIEVQLHADDQVVRLTVRDDGEMAGAASPGFGVLGMIERAELLGGECQAGPDGQRGWVVSAVLPRSGR